MSKLRCLLLGENTAHSLSPMIHEHFAAQFKLDIEYQTLNIRHDDFAKTVYAFAADGGRGINITFPYKALALEVADETHPSVSSAANTLCCTENHILAANTDGEGLVRALRFHQVKPQNILLIGAGGAARNVIPYLLALKPNTFHLANRTLANAQALRQEKMTVSDLTHIPFCHYDCVINATSASMADTIPVLDPQLIHAEAYYMDMAYQQDETAFMRWVRELGATRVYDGKAMLIEQAALAFELWTAQQPNTRLLHQSL